MCSMKNNQSKVSDEISNITSQIRQLSDIFTELESEMNDVMATVKYIESTKDHTINYKERVVHKVKATQI